MVEQLIKFFVVFFVVVEPISLIPLFAGLTSGASARYKKKMAGKAAAIKRKSSKRVPAFSCGGSGACSS